MGQNEGRVPTKVPTVLRSFEQRFLTELLWIYSRFSHHSSSFADRKSITLVVPKVFSSFSKQIDSQNYYNRSRPLRWRLAL